LGLRRYELRPVPVKNVRVAYISRVLPPARRLPPPPRPLARRRGPDGSSRLPAIGAAFDRGEIT